VGGFSKSTVWTSVDVDVGVSADEDGGLGINALSLPPAASSTMQLPASLLLPV